MTEYYGYMILVPCIYAIRDAHIISVHTVIAQEVRLYFRAVVRVEDNHVLVFTIHFGLLSS